MGILQEKEVVILKISLSVYKVLITHCFLSSPEVSSATNKL